MKETVPIRLFVVLFLLLFGVGTVVPAETIYFGVQASRSSVKSIKKWKSLGQYLEKKVGVKVKIVPLKPNKTVDAINEGKVDFMLSNPVLAVVVINKNGSKPIATMNKKSGHQFGGVIISKKGSGITKGKDLLGKKVMAYKFKKSAAAYVFQMKHLKNDGIDPHKDFKLFKEAKSQDDIVMAVQRGFVDGGFIKTGLLEAMENEGKISMNDFEIVDKINDDFAHVHSTTLYPSWTVTAGKNVDKAMSEKIKQALLSVADATEVTKKAKIINFVEPASLDGLSETLKELKLPPFEK